MSAVAADFTPETLANQGYAFAHAVVDSASIARFADLSDGLLDKRAGTRSVLDREWGIEFARSSAVRHCLALLGLQDAFCVRAIYFDKYARANWKVPWHQDRKIAVTARAEAPGFIGWSVKEGTVHCQPPANVLEHMVTLRFHLDRCGPKNGPLKVIPGSHRHGMLPSYKIDEVVHAGRVETLTCDAGDVIAMRPLLLHSSAPASEVGRRRVLHLEFSTLPLPDGLAWKWCV